MLPFDNQIAIDGPLRIADGYGNMTIGMIEGLAEEGIKVFSNQNWGKIDYDASDEVRVAVERGFGQCNYGIRCSQPDSFHIGPGKTKIGFSMWEFTHTPKANWRFINGQWVKKINWTDGMNKADINFVPCNFSKQLWIEAGCKKPIYVVPLGFNPDIYHWFDRPKRPKFTFIVAGTLSARKCPDMIKDAFLNVFKGIKDVQIIFKTPKHLPLEFKEKDERITIINLTYSEAEMNHLYTAGDVFISASQGEGFGLPAIEAMATGMPAIVTNWSAPPDYMDETIGWLLDYYMKNIDSDYFINRDDPKSRCEIFGFAQPKQDHLEQIMKHCYDNQNEVRAKGEHAYEKMIENYTWQHTAKRIINILKEG